MKNQKGQSLVEILVGLGVVSIMVGASTYSLVSVLRTSNVNEQNQVAGLFGNSLLEAATTLAEASWNTVYDLAKGPGNHYFIVNSPTTTPLAIRGDESVLSENITNGLVGHWKMDEAGGAAVYDLSGRGNTGAKIGSMPNLTDGLVGHWKLDELSGTAAYDSSGNNYTGSIGGSPQKISGSECVSGGCLNFTGTNFVDMGSSMAGTWSGLTITAWVKPSSIGTWRAVAQTANSGDRALYLQGRRLQMYSACNSSYDIPASGWVHVAVTINNQDSVVYYINGANAGGCTSGSNPRVVEYLHISGTSTGDGENFQGMMDDVRVYNRALSSDDISQIYNLPSCKAGDCLRFNGSANYINFGDVSSFDFGGNDFSVGGWVKEDNNGNYKPIFSKGDANGYGYFTGINGTSHVMTFWAQTSAGWNGLEGTRAFNDGNWHQFFITKTGTSVKHYFDGSLDKERTLNNATIINSSGRNAMIGRETAGGSIWYFSGPIDDIRLYNRELSATEISQLYNSSSYNRYFYAETVNRTACGAGDITTEAAGQCAGSSSNVGVDPATQKITATTWWNLKNAFRVFSDSNYVTRWVNNYAQQISWDGSDGVAGPVTEFGQNYFGYSNVSTSTSGSVKVSSIYQ